MRSISIKTSEALDRQAARGLIYSSKREIHGGFETLEYNIILAHGLSTQFERFVTIKELMHCYFEPNDGNVKYLTATEIALEKHMQVFFGNSTAESAPSRAETMALWMAVGVLCTEHDRKAMVADVKEQKLTADGIASQMCIPLKQAKNLISEVYDREIAKLIQ